LIYLLIYLPEWAGALLADDADITMQVAAVPKYRANRVQTIGELDEEARGRGGLKGLGFRV
jgi:hypothetical protein